MFNSFCFLSNATLLLKHDKIYTFFFCLCLRFANSHHMESIMKKIFSVIIANDRTSEVTLTTAVPLTELNTTSVVPLCEGTFTTTYISFEISSKNLYEISSSIPPLKSFTSFDKATTSNSGIIVIYIFLLIC